MRNAVEAALKAAGGWAKKEAHVKAQIMYYMAENLQARRGEFVALLSAMLGQGAAERCEQEVDLSVQRLFYWAAYCDKFGGDVQVGVIGRVFLQVLLVGKKCICSCCTH